MKQFSGGNPSSAPAKSQLSAFDLAMIVVSLVVGMGIFRTPVNAAQQSADGNMFFLAWVIGGIVALCGALTFAEIGSRYPVTGGYYKIFSSCYHPSYAFAINGIILVSNAASLAAVALIGSEYLTNVAFKNSPDKESIKLTISTISIIVFYALNFLGLKASARLQNILTVIKIAMVILLCGALFTGVEAPAESLTGSEGDGGGWMSYIRMMGATLVAVSFTYGGYQLSINFGGETREASRSLPRGIAMGIAIVMVLYFLINYTYIKVIGFEELRRAESIGAILAGTIFGEKGYLIFSLLLFLSVLGYVNVSLMNNPRMMYAMSEDRILPAVFQRRHPRTGVMAISLTAFTALCMVTLFYARTFDQILTYVIIFESLGKASAGATIFILRRRTVHLDPKSIFRVPLYPVAPLILIITYLLLGVSITLDEPRTALVSLLLFTGFFALYFVLRRKHNL